MTYFRSPDRRIPGYMYCCISNPGILVYTDTFPCWAHSMLYLAGYKSSCICRPCRRSTGDRAVEKPEDNGPVITHMIPEATIVLKQVSQNLKWSQNWSRSTPGYHIYKFCRA